MNIEIIAQEQALSDMKQDSIDTTVLDGTVEVLEFINQGRQY